jgi:hypothetical protein
MNTTTTTWTVRLAPELLPDWPKWKEEAKQCLKNNGWKVVREE